MSRPTRTNINSSESGWVTRFESNSTALIDAPVPLVQYASAAALSSAKDARLNQDCLALVGSSLYKSNGTTWELYREQLTFIADLDTGTATIADIRTAYNGLLSDMISKNWMLAS